MDPFTWAEDHPNNKKNDSPSTINKRSTAVLSKVAKNFVVGILATAKLVARCKNMLIFTFFVKPTSEKALIPINLAPEFMQACEEIIQGEIICTKFYDDFGYQDCLIEIDWYCGKAFWQTEFYDRVQKACEDVRDSFFWGIFSIQYCDKINSMWKDEPWIDYKGSMSSYPNLAAGSPELLRDIFEHYRSHPLAHLSNLRFFNLDLPNLLFIGSVVTIILFYFGVGTFFTFKIFEDDKRKPIANRALATESGSSSCIFSD